MTDSVFYRRCAVIALAVLLVSALAKVLAPFAGALAWGICLAFLLSPLQRWLTRRMRGRAGLAAGLITAATPFVLLVPGITLALIFTKQAAALVQQLQSGGFALDRSALARVADYPLVIKVTNWLSENTSVTTEQINAWLSSAAQSVLKVLAASGGSFVLGAFGVVVSLFLMLFLLYFLLRDGPKMLQRVVKLVPLPAARRDELLDLVGKTTRAVVVGTGATAMAQGTLVGIGFALVGLPSPLVFGVLATLLALLPAGGTALVWGPGVLWLFASGHTGKALVLLVWGIGVTLVDNLLRPLLISQYSPVSTLAVFVGVVGGVAAFGAIGLIAGPVFLTLVTALLRFIDEVEFAPR